ncbi:hypothetical protein [Zhihengliuella halotolerans]|uniref:hypothetical protein n=1 Tax=Zhihengliuella halotolerans TaxID=370736 RepID=UPI000C803869|nr:hypothetical protein [Zhihengliuella halotolerans]
MDAEEKPSFDAVDFIADVHAVVLRVETPEGRPDRYRRRVYLNLCGAQKALDKARARGLDGEIVLCRLQPVTGR